MAMLDESYPQEAWTHIYTDGSAKDAIKDGGAGVHIRYPTGDIEENKAPTGTNCSTYKAEVEALKLAIDMIAGIEETQVVFLTDTCSMLYAMDTEKERELTNKLADLNKQKKVALQWIPAHYGIPGNEKADQLAKQGARAAIQRAEKKHLAHRHKYGKQAVPGPGGAEEDHSLHLQNRPGAVANKSWRMARRRSKTEY